MTPGTLTESADSQRFFLEAHYYDAGLRIKPLGTNAARPRWVPPPDYVGFRNEVTLAGGDSAVEFSRIIFQARRVTWVGVFYRSVDHVFGDRQNHAGVGVWLLDADVVDAANLLHGLRQFAAEVADGNIETIVSSADRFLDAEYLPGYVRTSCRLPSRLAGWSYGETAMPTSALFIALGNDARQAWEAAAEQIMRMSLLPGPTAAHSRALILVPTSNERASEVRQKTELGVVKRGLLSELISIIPDAIIEIAHENAVLTDNISAFRTHAQKTESALEEANLSNRELANRIAQLETDIQENDTLRRLLRIDKGLSELSARTTSIDNGLREVKSELTRIRKENADTEIEWLQPRRDWSSVDVVRWLSVTVFFIAGILLALLVWQRLNRIEPGDGFLPPQLTENVSDPAI